MHKVSQTKRRGTTLPLIAVLLVPMMGMVAFAVDIGYLTMTQSELQNTADASAMAGATSLMEYYPQWAIADSTNKPTIRANAVAGAIAAAKEYGLYHEAGAVAVTVLDADIEVGFTAADGTYTSNPAVTVFPNTVKVTTRRDDQANGAVSLFFAPVIGTSSTNLSATAKAAIYTGYIESLETIPANALILPFTYNFYDYKQEVENATTGELKIYSTNKDTGNFGELALDGTSGGTSEIIDWINNGLSNNDISNLAGLSPSPIEQNLDGNYVIKDHNFVAPSADTTSIGTLNPPGGGYSDSAWNWNGNPGFRASTVMEVNKNHVGATGYLPLFEPYEGTIAPPPTKGGGKGGGSTWEAGRGQGSNYYYKIVGFATVKILQPGQINKEIIVKPSGEVSPKAVFSNVNLAGTSSYLQLDMAGAKIIE